MIMGFRKHGFRLNKVFFELLTLKYSRSFVVSGQFCQYDSCTVVEKPGNTLCFDSEVDRHSPMEYLFTKRMLYL